MLVIFYFALSWVNLFDMRMCLKEEDFLLFFFFFENSLSLIYSEFFSTNTYIV